MLILQSILQWPIRLFTHSVKVAYISNLNRSVIDRRRVLNLRLRMSCTVVFTCACASVSPRPHAREVYLSTHTVSLKYLSKSWQILVPFCDLSFFSFGHPRRAS